MRKSRPSFRAASLVALYATSIVATAAEPALCDSLVQDKLAHPMSAVPRPAKGQSVVDSEFHTRIFRVTDAQADFGSRIAKPAYSTTPAWNADESLMVLYVAEPTRGHMLYDGRTYRFLRRLDIAPADIEQFYWDPVDPKILWFIYNWEESGRSVRRLVRYHVDSGHADPIHDFTGCGLPYGDQVNGGSDPQYNSWDNQLWGLRCRREYPKQDVFSFRLSSSKESPRQSGSAVTPVACPSGTCLWAPGPKSSVVLDPDTYAVRRKLTLDGSEHGDLGRNAAGEDYFASVQFDGRVVGTLVTENLQTGAVRVVVGPSTGYPYPPSGTHVSAIAMRRPGWVAVSVTGHASGQKLLDSELLVANVDTGQVCRVGHHRSTGSDGPNGYWAEPHVNISPSGTRLLFGSDWGSGTAVDSYVLELPSYSAVGGAVSGQR